MIFTTLLASGLVGLAAAQGGYEYDSNNHFVNPPAAVAPHAFDEAAVFPAGQGQLFSWVTTYSPITVRLWQENNSSPLTLATNFTGSSIAWNGQLPAGFDYEEDYAFLTINNLTEQLPVIYSSYFRFSEDGSANSTSNSTVSSTSSTSTSSRVSSASSSASASVSSVSSVLSSVTSAAGSSASSAASNAATSASSAAATASSATGNSAIKTGTGLGFTFMSFLLAMI